MSNLIFPALPGLKWSTYREPIWQTTLKTSDSGRDFSMSTWSSPRWAYKLQYEFLRAGAEQELQQLVGFFNRHQGNHDTWLYDDPDDNTAAGDLFGAGDGVTTVFQLARTFGGYSEPVYELNGMPVITQTDWRGAWVMSTSPRTNMITQSAADSAVLPWARGANLARVGNTTAPDGSNTATVYTATTAANAYIGQDWQAYAAVVYVASVYAKLVSGTAPASGSLMSIAVDTDGNTGTIERVGRDFLGLSSTWQRFSLPVTSVSALASTQAFFCSDFANGAQIAVWGAQLEDSMWRIDGAVLYATRSTTAPDGSQDAVKLVERATTGAHYLDDHNPTRQAGAAVPYTWYIKAAERSLVRLECYSDPTTASLGVVLVDASTGQISTPTTAGATLTASIASAGDGWWRVSLVFNPATADTKVFFRAAIVTGSFSGANNTVYAGTVGQGIYLATDAGICKPTRYIPTTTAARTVTDVTVGSLGQITLGDAPAIGAVLTWVGKFYWRCRFSKSSIEFEQFMRRLWSAKSIEFKTDKP